MAQFQLCTPKLPLCGTTTHPPGHSPGTIVAATKTDVAKAVIIFVRAAAAFADRYDGHYIPHIE